MERNRDARRGAVVVVNGGGSGGLSRRRHRNSSRDSPDGDAVMEMPETARLRDRGGGGGKKDRDRSGRSKRRRRERMLHGSSNRDDGDESSEDSLDDEDDDEEDDVTVRFPLPSHPPAANPSSSSSPQRQQQPNHHHYHHHQHHQHHSQQPPPPPQQQRKSFPPKVSKPPLVWKADEMIGVAVPRKARSAVKRSHECWVSGGAGGLGGGEQVPRPASTSPSRLSPASTSQISPSSSNASLRKKMKFTSGSKQRPPKISKAPSSSVIQDDIEIEVAEVLFGMTRQQFCPPKQETHKVDAKEIDGDTVNEARSRVSSPASPSRNPFAPPPPNSTFHPPVPAIAPKRKKPRPVKFEDESPTSSPAGHGVPNSSMSSAMKFDGQNLIKTEASSPRSEQNRASHVVENGDSSAAEIAALQTEVAQPDEQQEEAKLERDQVRDLKLSTNHPSIKGHIDCKDGTASATEATLCTNLDVKLNDATALNKKDADSPRQEKFSIDLMAPPPGKLPPDGEDGCKFDPDQKPAIPEAEMVAEGKNQEMLVTEQAASRDCDMMDKSVAEKQMAKEHALNLRFDLKKANKDDGNGKLQVQKQQQKAPKVEPKQEKCVPTTPVNMPMAVGAWPGGFPSFGYMGQVPTLQGVIPVDGSAGTANAFLPPFMTHQSRQKRCAKHFFIAQAIHNYQKLVSMNPFWSAATTNAIFGAKPYIMPHSDAALFTNPMQASFPGRNMGSLHDTKISPVGGAAYTGYTSTDKMATTNAPMTEVAQKKQVVLQQAPHSGSTTNMLHAPAFIFPINQQQAAAVTPTANKAASTKSTPGPGNLMTPAGASSSAAGSSGSNGAVTPMNLNFTGFPTGDAQYLAMMQSNPYHFPLPPHVAGASPFRGTTPPQGMPYFFPSHMLHPSQIQPQQQQLHAGPSQTPHASQNHQKTSTSSGSSSSQKHIQQSNLASGLVVAGTNSHGFPASNQKQHGQSQNARQGSEKGSEENPPASEGGASQVQKGMYGQSFSIANHHQNFSLMPSAAAATVVGSVGGHGDKQVMSHQHQQKLMDLTSPSTFTLPFTAYNGTGAVLHGLDFSSLSQNHTILQALPEAARHGYHQIATASQVAQNKKHTTDDSKSLVRESMNGTVTTEDERKATADRKNAGSGLQSSFTFSKPGGEATIPISSVLNNNAMDNSSRTLNLIQSPTNVSRTVNQPLGSVPTSSMAMGTTSIPSHQHHQQILQIQRQQQQHQLSSSRSKNSVSTNSSGVHSDRLAGSSTMSKFPQPPTGFPQTVMQDGSPQTQIKTSGRSAQSISVSSSAPPIVKSNHLVHQQVRSAAHQPLPVQSHQTQISFSMNSVKVMPAAGQNFSGVGNPSVAAVAVSSPCNSIPKSAGSSPRSLTGGKPSPTTVVPHPQQSSSKAPASSSTSKTFPAGSLPSILGHPQNTAGNSSTKLQQQQQLPQSLKQQPYPQAQFYFTNAYMQQPHPVQSNAATTAVPTGYYQKRQADQAIQQIPQQQLTPVLGSSAMLALCSSAPPVPGTSADPAKAMAAAGGNATNTKGMSQANLLHPSQFTVAHSAASGSPHALVPAAFPYMSMPAISVKAAVDQKPAAGSDNLNWQPEKR